MTPTHFETADAPQVAGEDRAPLVERGFLVAFAVVTSLFFMWAIANNFNDILIKQFQKALELTRMESGLIQTAFYFGYFTFALPAGWFIARRGYKAGIIAGLGLYAVGALLFWPAAGVREFGFFLIALYVIAAGLAFLETAANPLIAAMGREESAAQRLTLAQSFNGLGGVVAPFLGGALIFSGIDHSAADLAAMTPEQIDSYRATEALAVRLPYLALAGVVLTLAAIVALTRFPAIAEEEGSGPAVGGLRAALRSPRLRAAILAQFFYVGAQVTVWSYFINFAQDLTGIGEKLAAQWLGFSLFLFMVGRFAGAGLMRFARAPLLLTAYGLIAAVLCGISMVAGGMVAVVALGLTSLFMSIMFPTIFTLGLAGLGQSKRMASSLIVMSIIGGAIFPPLTGLLADRLQSLSLAMIVPLVCFLVVAHFGRRVSLDTSREVA
ncbi:L-fucose:H+ symporter permease [Altererythrobacter sp.]|uniref:L-fucose:H+ symporter permease n=1 Tax=Altererythrobacter sp. TaxID=1872480 RepID=UPI003D05C377